MAKEKPKENPKGAKGLYYYLRQAWKKPEKETLRKRMVEWRKSSVFTKVDKPLRLDRERAQDTKTKKDL